MISIKCVIRATSREVRYDKERWRLLEELRGRASKIMEGLGKGKIHTIVHGSLARGDVDEGSDIDIFIPYRTPSFMIEHSIAEIGYEATVREIVQATPHSVVKAYITLDEKTTVSFPITDMTVREREFYRFGGELTLNDLGRRARVPGVSKELVLIAPTRSGHREMPVVGHEGEVAKIVGVGLGVVMERVRVLTRRRRVGRTGVFLKQSVPPHKMFEQAFSELKRRHRLQIRDA